MAWLLLVFEVVWCCHIYILLPARRVERAIIAGLWAMRGSKRRYTGGGQVRPLTHQVASNRVSNGIDLISSLTGPRGVAPGRTSRDGQQEAKASPGRQPDKKCFCCWQSTEALAVGPLPVARWVRGRI